MFRVFFIFFVGACLLGCSPRDLEDFQASGEEVANRIALELAAVHSPKELANKKNILKKEFRKLAKLMVEAAEYQRKHEDEELDRLNLHPTSDRLCYEFLRVASEIEGGKLFLEELQQEMLDRLDVDIRKHQKAKSKLK